MAGTDPNHHGNWWRWRGFQELGLMPWLARSPGVIVWAEGDLFGGAADLLITWEGSRDYPLRVPPGWWLHFDGKLICAFERGPE